MRDEEFERYLILLGSMLRFSPRQREEIARELRDHLESRVVELVGKGVDEQAAVRRAIEELGDAATVAARFQEVSCRRRKRRMMRYATLSIAAIFGVVMWVVAMWPERARLGAPMEGVAQGGQQDTDSSAIPAAWIAQPTVHEQNLKVMKKLEIFTSWEYDEKRFQDILEDSMEHHGLNILNHRSARDSGLDEETKVSFRIHETPLATALQLMLGMYECTYTFRDGVMIILSMVAAHLDENHVVNAFNVKALFEGNTHLMEGAGADRTAQRTQELVGLIKRTVHPPAWEENGGESLIEAHEDLIVVRSTAWNIHEIGSLLDKMHSLRMGR